MALTGRGVRGELAVDVAVQDFGCVTVPILAKVYTGSDSSATHGECVLQQGMRGRRSGAAAAGQLVRLVCGPACRCCCLKQHAATA
jgi:hypothetical protein